MALARLVQPARRVQGGPHAVQGATLLGGTKRASELRGFSLAAILVLAGTAGAGGMAPPACTRISTSTTTPLRQLKLPYLTHGLD